MSANKPNCYHCATPIPRGVKVELNIKGEPEPFCCPACRAVTQTIIGSGFDRFYDHRGSTEFAPASDKQLELELYDSEAIQKSFVRQQAEGTQEASLVIGGINCAACVWLLEKHLDAQPGVIQFQVNLTNHRARLKWDPTRVKLSELFSRILSIGYIPHPYHPNKEEALFDQEKKRAIRRLGVAGIGMMQVMMMAAALYLSDSDTMTATMENFIRWTSLIVATPVVLYSARPFFEAAIRDIRVRHLSMDVPVSIAIGGAYIASIWATLTRTGEVYFDSVSMFTFFLLIGRFFEMQARHRTGIAGNALANLLPASAIRLTDQGEELIPASELKTGDRVLVKPGHTVPADGILLTDHTNVDESALTGEPLPVHHIKGDALVGGTLNLEQSIEVEITATGDMSRISAILDLLDRAQSDKPRVAKVADTVASYFVVAVLITASLVSTYWWFVSPEDALWVTLSVLVVTCPCALSLATPTALTAALGTLRQKGLLVTRGHVLESLAQISLVAFDKTGTLTTGKLTLRETKVLAKDYSEIQCQEIAAALESRSEHPIAAAFSPYFKRAPESTHNLVGQGIEGVISSITYRLGKPEFTAQIAQGEILPRPSEEGLWLQLSSAKQAICWFLIDDQLRPEAAKTLADLKALGLKTLMLTGDHQSNAERMGAQLGIDHIESDLTPEVKLEQVKALQNNGEQVLMVGDGINDIPVLSGAQTSIAMSSATDLAKTSADAVLINSDLRNLVMAVKLARRTRQIIRQNISWALIYNLTALPLAATGQIAPWMAAIGMSASSLVVVANALRLTRQK